ncbi:hypothetical protein Scep_030312 [Stephania cephalantha]|uniref:SMP domain-containing protein n=1 Tax=Stephania cephalantha TaxID=152367 RepID=A0AAP0DZJ2_9MAGN
MSQQQQQLQREGDAHEAEHPQPIKYGDVFPVSGELATKPIAPQDAAMMQTAENLVLGQTQKGGAAATMQAAATLNERAGLVSHKDTTDIAGVAGVTVSETDLRGHRIVTESVAGQVVDEHYRLIPVVARSPVKALDRDAITIGEALEATALMAGDKPVEVSDAAAIQAAEVRAAGTNMVAPGGIAASAQAAASANQRSSGQQGKTTLADVLSDASLMLPADKVVTGEDAERVIAAEVRNEPYVGVKPGGVGDSMAAAARLNQKP